MKKLLTIAVLALLMAGIAGCSGSAPTDEDPQIALGQRLYEQGNNSGATPCLACHSLDGTALVGPTFQNLANVAAERRPGLTAEEYLRESITMPAAYVVEGYSNAMPANYPDTLTEEEVEALVAWMLTLDGEE